MFLLFLLTFCDKNDQVNQDGTMDSIFTIDLISNPTTGYTWKWTNKQSITIVDSITHNFTPKYPDRVGSGGIETWKFKGKKKGTEVLEFKYNRSWDPNSTIDQKAITITVK
ncbi:MAG: protease inhibitor I42 family protein, partial [Bacteroidia bacterium]|nr:protease inhibitor I42 family protein [Bacteroidia bacterium]